MNAFIAAPDNNYQPHSCTDLGSLCSTGRLGLFVAMSQLLHKLMKISHLALYPKHNYANFINIFHNQYQSAAEFWDFAICWRVFYLNRASCGSSRYANSLNYKRNIYGY